MIINNNFKKNLNDLDQVILPLLDSNSLTDTQIENFLRIFEKARFNLLNEIKLYNKMVEFEYEKINRIKYFLRENKNKNADIICSNEII